MKQPQQCRHNSGRDSVAREQIKPYGCDILGLEESSEPACKGLHWCLCKLGE
jgi:hypothetical protein